MTIHGAKGKATRWVKRLGHGKLGRWRMRKYEDGTVLIRFCGRCGHRFMIEVERGIFVGHMLKYRCIL